MFHMKNSGLPNVWLEDGYETGEDKFGPYYSIIDIPGLYKAISMEVARGRGSLSASELRLLRRQLELTQKDLGLRIGRTEQTVLLWEKEECEARSTKIPDNTARLIKLMLLQHLFPHMNIDDAFCHIETERPEKIILTRRDGRWESVLNRFARVRQVNQWIVEPSEKPSWPMSSTRVLSSGVSHQSSKICESARENAQWMQ